MKNGTQVARLKDRREPVIRRENGGCGFMPTGRDMIQITELFVLVVVIVVIDVGTILQFHLIQRITTRY